MRAYGDLKSTADPSGVIDKKPAAAVHPADVPKTTIAQDSFAVPASDGAPIVEAGANVHLDRDGLRSGGRNCRYKQTENEAQARERVTRHRTLSMTSLVVGEINSALVRLSRKGGGDLAFGDGHTRIWILCRYEATYWRLISAGRPGNLSRDISAGFRGSDSVPPRVVPTEQTSYAGNFCWSADKFY